ncbi:NADH dehydrogenase [ubiquinone] 1 alpha subcomplex subunit 1 [Puntigrus tetrazona]|uniref:NADH dehydrogenase [ubiquinone] 1 alpha subcomplex subunit 1 n=1 Tax=Puntigrus tetrazona TaxID=1606681 RepID=UPI001C894247|nr:NADH dehydrogenase [ubiquinone] 1 alpha subcomplex subunit 1 [Puntigrus tetrazona]
MWYEILPGFAIMTVCLMIPGIAGTHIQKLTNRNKEKRVVHVPYQLYLMERDKRVSGTGTHYHTKGLENIN